MSDASRSLDELWLSDNQRWGAVREVIVREQYAAVLDDLNGDGREVELRVYERVSDGWRFVLHQDDVSASDGSVDQVGGWSVGFYADSPGTFCYLGRGRPGTRIRVSFGGLAQELGIGDDGWWLWAMPMDPDEAQTHVSGRNPWSELRVEPLD